MLARRARRPGAGPGEEGFLPPGLESEIATLRMTRRKPATTGNDFWRGRGQGRLCGRCRGWCRA